MSFQINKKILARKSKKLLALITAKLINSFKIENADFIHFDFFEIWKKSGFFIIPDHFYQPLPDISSLNSKFFQKENDLSGININFNNQLNLLKNVFAKFKKEFLIFKNYPKGVDNQQDPNFYFKNSAFDGVDALVYYCLIRFLHPQKIIEVGSGWSTKIAAKAAIKNKDTKLTSIEPYPQPILLKGFPGFNQLIRKKVEKVPFSQFEDLKENDILFIDSSHTVKTGGDVNYLFFEILPKLKKGVYVHLHDIFFPFDYPQEWVLKEHRFWNEQYLLHAFLMYNDSFEVVYSNSLMGYKYPREVKKVFSHSPFLKGGSIWLKKIK